MSLFVSFEGGEGSGKTVQAELLTNRLRQAGVPVLPVHEPGLTPLGEYLRSWLKRETRPISPGAEIFMFAAARAELVAKTLKPAMERPGLVVVADRYADSTSAYQGYGRRLRLRDVDAVNRLATQGIMPDVTFLLDCSPEEGLRRTGPAQASMALDPAVSRDAGRIDDEGTRRFEEESLDFHRRVRAGYLKMARREPKRWQIIDATQPAETVGGLVWSRVRDFMANSPATGSVEANPNLRLWGGQADAHSSSHRPEASEDA